MRLLVDTEFYNQNTASKFPGFAEFYIWSASLKYHIYLIWHPISFSRASFCINLYSAYWWSWLARFKLFAKPEEVSRQYMILVVANWEVISPLFVGKFSVCSNIDQILLVQPLRSLKRSNMWNRLLHFVLKSSINP